MRKLGLAIVLLIASACTPEERLLWDEIHNFPEGTTHQAICELDPQDPYCGEVVAVSSSETQYTEPEPQMTEHDILWQAINDTFPNSEHHTARRVAQCESGDNKDFKSIDMDAVSPTNDHGPFQINEPTWNKPWHQDPVAQYVGHNWHNRFDPVTNTHMAYRIWEVYGWDMWACY